MTVPVTSHHHWVEVNGIRLHYTIAASGAPVVLLHGFPMTSFYWRKIGPALAERYTVVAPDLRGCGDSDRPSSGYDKRTVAEDLHGLVRHLRLGPINLVSHDVGMMVASAYARHLGAPGALHGGIEYFRTHAIDAAHNREFANTKLPMPVLTVAGASSLGASLEPEVRPLVARMRSVVLDECGHYLAEERPEQLTEALLAFLAEPV